MFRLLNDAQKHNRKTVCSKMKNDTKNVFPIYIYINWQEITFKITIDILSQWRIRRPSLTSISTIMLSLHIELKICTSTLFSILIFFTIIKC